VIVLNSGPFVNEYTYGALRRMLRIELKQKYLVLIQIDILTNDTGVLVEPARVNIRKNPTTNQYVDEDITAKSIIITIPGKAFTGAEGSWIEIKQGATIKKAKYKIEGNNVHEQPWKYPWSSCSAHIGESPSSLLDLENWKQETDPESWKEYRLGKVSIDQIEGMELNIRTGRPLGSDAFISKLETRLNRRLRPLPVGRPKNPASGKTVLSDKKE